MLLVWPSWPREGHEASFLSLPVSPLYQSSSSKIFVEREANYTSSLLVPTSASFPGLLVSRSFLASLGLQRRLCVQENLIVPFCLLHFCFMIMTHYLWNPGFPGHSCPGDTQEAMTMPHSWTCQDCQIESVTLTMNCDYEPLPTSQVFLPPQLALQHWGVLGLEASETSEQSKSK